MLIIAHTKNKIKAVCILRFNMPIKLLWSKKYENKIFIKTIRRNKFELILRCLRFDDWTAKAERITGGLQHLANCDKN